MKKIERMKIIENIKYEIAKGIHTYSMCPKCKVCSCRGDLCVYCLLEKLK